MLPNQITLNERLFPFPSLRAFKHRSRNHICLYMCVNSPCAHLTQLLQRPSDDGFGERKESDGALFLRGFPFCEAQTPEDVDRVSALCHKALPGRRLHHAHAGECKDPIMVGL